MGSQSSSPPCSIGDSVELSINDISYGGNGVGRVKNFAIFVPRTAIGDRVRVEITSMRRRFGKGRIIELLEHAPERKEPECPHYEHCGGCHYQHLAYENSVQIKVTQLQETIRRLGKQDLDFPVHDFFSPSQKMAYRNRLTFHRDSHGNQGYIHVDRHTVLDIPFCPIAEPILNDLWQDIRGKISDIPSSTLPYVFLRSTSEKQAAVVFSLHKASSSKEVKKALLNLCADLKGEPSLFVTEIEESSHSPFGDNVECIKGNPNITEKVLNMRFSLEPDVFFQVHPETREALIQSFLSWLEGKTDELLDLFCGAGFFSLFAAKQGIHVYGIDSNDRAIHAAQRSAENESLNHLSEFRAGKADRILENLREKDRRQFKSAIVDPPRGGLGKSTIKRIDDLGIDSLFYVSCSPPTMARDMNDLRQFGYKVQSIQPFDMFPMTYHIETIATLEKAI